MALVGVLAGAELQLGGDRRVPTPRFNLLSDLWGVIPSTVSRVSRGNTRKLASAFRRLETLSLSRQKISLRGLTERSLAHLIIASACAFKTVKLYNTIKTLQIVKTFQ